MTSRLLALAVVVLAGLGCGAAKPTPAAPTGLPWEANGQLALVRVTTQLTDAGTSLVVSVKNPYPEPVHGVRVVYRILVSPDADAAEVARTQTSFSDVVAPGQETSLTIALPARAGEAGFGTFLHAFAMRLGARDVPPPPFWGVEPQ